MNKKKRIMMVVCSLILVASISIVGTMAYLTDETEEVENTFTVGSLFDPDAPDPEEDGQFVLYEHEAFDEDEDGVYLLESAGALSDEVTENTYKVLPNVNIPKDPFVRTDVELELDAYVFVEVVDNTTLTFAVDDGLWTSLGIKGTKGGDMYVLKANDGIVEAGNKLPATTILKNNTITVGDDGIAENESLSFYGYLIQKGTFANAKAAFEAAYPAPEETTKAE